MAAARELIREKFATELIGEEGESLAEHLLALFQSQKLTLASAESCTGGSIAGALTDVAGASSVYLGGFVTYSNEAKVRDLGVSEDSLLKYGAVSDEVCREMADGCLEQCGADVAVVCTGIAGPTGGSEEKPVGTVFIGVAQRGCATKVWHHVFRGDRLLFKQRVVVSALDHVRKSIAKNAADGC